MKKFAAIAVAALALAACTSKTEITVENHSSVDRKEIVEVDLKSVSVKAPFVVKAATGEDVPYQITHDGLLIFPVSVAANSAASFTVEEGQPSEAQTIATGKHYPERVDDIAWENDRVAFRAYGPALQKSGERAFGYDVWNKRVAHPVVEDRYRTELNPATKARLDSLRACDPQKADSLWHAVSYHYDHGNGNDCYKVGPTLGGGTAAIMVGDSIAYPYCYKDFEILDNGPIRFAVRLVYNPEVIEGDTVVETREISLDAGSQLNKTKVKFAGLSKNVTVASGIVLHHPDGGKNVADAENGVIAYADPTDDPDNDNGTIFVGAIVPNCKAAKMQMFSDDERTKLRGGANGHLLAKADYAPGSELTYYWGGAWTKWGFDSFDDWSKYMDRYAKNLKEPLTVVVK